MNCKGNTGYKFMVSAGFEYCNAEVKERLENEICYLFVRFFRLSLKFLSVVVADNYYSMPTYWEDTGEHNQLASCKPNRKRGS